MFKKLITTFIFVLFFSEIVNAKTVTVDVNGLVCEFCASTIEKNFQKNDRVESVEVDLETKKVTIDFKENQNLSDEEIEKIILNNGYNVEKVNR